MSSDSTDADATRLGHTAAPAGAETTLGQIGLYRLLSVLGEGGMGRVFEAEQASPRRRVALKVIRGQFADDLQIRMFLREAETLGRLEHPNIGAIYESGRTADGQHYFAMELVRGRTLDAFLTARGATIDGAELTFRLSLFGVIADAVHYAHQRGVIHRDLKPSNLMVTDAAESSASLRSGTALPTVKILDFGLARLADAEQQTTATDVGVIKGTLAYMSPEQARGSAADVDVRSDVYALGVVLYEMLAGRRPYDTQRGSLIEAVRVICEDAPTALSSVWPGPVRLDPDIATIIGKAIEKDPSRRYASAVAMSEDVRRYLSAQPIQARPPSTLYLLRRFTQRHRGMVGAIAAILVVILTGSAVATYQAVRATRAETLASRRADDATAAQTVAERRRVEADTARALADQRRQEAEAATVAAETARRAESAARDIAERRRQDAERATAEAETARARESAERQRADASAATARDEAAKALAINDFLTADLLASIMPSSEVGRGRDVSMREVIDEAARRIGTAGIANGRYDGQPLVEASIRLALGRTYRVLGEYDKARGHIERALDLRQRARGRSSLDTQEAVSELGNLLDESGRPADAEPLLREVLRERTSQHASPIDIAKAQANLGIVLSHLKQYADAEALLRAAESMLDGAANVPPDVVFGAHNNLATVLMDSQRPADALPVLEDARRALIASVGPDAPATLIVGSNLASVYRQLGRSSDAERLLSDIAPVARRVAGENHPAVIGGQTNLAAIWNGLGKVQQTVDAMPTVYATAKTVLGLNHPTTRLAALVLGEAYGRSGRAELALPLLTDSVTSFRAEGSANTMDGVMARTALIRTLMSLGRPRDARQDAAALADLAAQQDGAASLRAILARQLLGFVMLATGEVTAAETALTETDAALRARAEDVRASIIEGEDGLASVRERQGRENDAIALMKSVATDATAAFGRTDTRALLALARLGNMLTNSQRGPEAESYLRAAHEGLAATLGPSHPMTLGPLFDLWSYAHRAKPAQETGRIEAVLVPATLTAANQPAASIDTAIRASILLRRAVDKRWINLPESLRLAERVATANPANASVWLAIAEARLANKQRAQAAAALERTVALLPAGAARAELEARIKDLRR